MNDKLIERLRKLLALAGNNPSQNEAELAMQKAQEIALEHGIDLALIGNITEEESTIIRENFNFGQRLPTVNAFVTNILVKYFNVRIITSGSRENGRSLIFVGSRDAISTAKYIYDWLSNTMVNCWKVFYEKTSGISLKDKQAYLFGFYGGLDKKLEHNRQVIEGNKLTNENDKNKYALVQTNLKNRINSFVEKEFPSLRRLPAKNISIGNGNSYNQGYIDGGNCNIVKGGIDGNKVAGYI